MSPYSFAANNPIELIDDNGEDPVKPLGWFKKAWYRVTNQHYLIRTNEYAVKNKIDESQIFFYSYNNRNFSIVIDSKYDATTDEYVETKHVLRESYIKAPIATPFWSEKNDSHGAEVDNYFDAEGKPVPTEDDESNAVIAYGGGPGKLGKAGSLAEGVMMAGRSSKSWTVYTFPTNTPKSGTYFGITVDYARRIVSTPFFKQYLLEDFHF